MKIRKLLIVGFALMLVGCGSAGESQVTVNAEVKEDAVKTDAEHGEEVSKVVEEPQIEDTVEVLNQGQSEDGTKTYPTKESWVYSIDCSVPVLTVYNTETKEGLVLEDKQVYEVKKGDQLIMCAEWRDKINCAYLGYFLGDAEIVHCIDNKSAQLYNFPTEAGEWRIELEVTLDDEPTVYNLQCTAIVGELTISKEDPKPASADERVVYEGIDYDSTLPVEDWVETFVGIDEPKAIIYNAETNKHIILEGGEKVFLEEGDEFGIYSPEITEGNPYDSAGGPIKSKIHTGGSHYYPIGFDEEIFTRGYDFSFTFGDTKLSFFLIPHGSEF